MLNHMGSIKLYILLTFFAFANTHAFADSKVSRNDKIVSAVAKLLNKPEKQISLASSKLIIDKLVDPSINIQATIQTLDKMAAEVYEFAGTNITDDQKIAAIRVYIYKAGVWNDNRPFAYNMKDPLGTYLPSKLLTNYIDSRLGNCISMPFLFMAVAERMGVTLTASTAPNHVFLKYRTDAGKMINLETTSGANPARNAWIRQQMPMTDAAVKNGVYLKTLTKKETVVVMATLLVEHAMKEGRYGTVLNLANVLLSHYPNYAALEVFKGAASYKILEREFYKKFPKPQMIPERLRRYYQHLSHVNEQAFNRAEALGWRPEGAIKSK